MAAAPVRGGHSLRDPVLHHQSGVLLQPGPALHEVHSPGDMKQQEAGYKMDVVFFLFKALYLMTSAFGNLITLVIVALFSSIGVEQVTNIRKFE